MNTKLTLTIDSDVIERAKKKASESGRSVSDIVENYLKVVTSDMQTSTRRMAPDLQALRGSFKDSGENHYKKQLADSLADKYL